MFALWEINQSEQEMCLYLEWQLNVKPSTLKVFDLMVWKHFRLGLYPAHYSLPAPSLESFTYLKPRTTNILAAIPCFSPRPLLTASLMPLGKSSQRLSVKSYPLHLMSGSFPLPPTTLKHLPCQLNISHNPTKLWEWQTTQRLFHLPPLQTPGDNTPHTHTHTPPHSYTKVFTNSSIPEDTGINRHKAYITQENVKCSLALGSCEVKCCLKFYLTMHMVELIAIPFTIHPCSTPSWVILASCLNSMIFSLLDKPPLNNDTTLLGDHIICSHPAFELM